MIFVSLEDFLLVSLMIPEPEMVSIDFAIGIIKEFQNVGLIDVGRAHL